MWIVATSLSYAGGGKVSAFVTDYIKNDFGVFLSFAVMSLAIAIAQWLVIRRHIRGIGWLWTTLVGGAVGGSLSSWASFQLAVTYGDAIDLLSVYGCLRGLTTGFMQSLILKQYFQLADWWIIGTTISWYISLQVGFFLLDKHLGYFLTTVVGAIYGLLTGGIFMVLYSQKVIFKNKI